MLVHEVMTSPVVTVTPDMRVKDAGELLVRRDITAAPVVDMVGRLIGIVSELDIVRGEVEVDPRAHLRRAQLDNSPPPRTVADIMTAEVIAVPAGTDVADVVALMVGTGVKSVPVVDDGRPVGIVSRRDVLRMLVRDDAVIRAEVERRVREDPRGRGVSVAVREGVVRLSGGDEVDRRGLALVASTVAGVVRVEAGTSLRA